jgi:hypothetical protein
MALLARFTCGCNRRVEIPAPPVVSCEQHNARARLISTPRGQVRYVAEPFGEPGRGTSPAPGPSPAGVAPGASPGAGDT